MPGGTRAVPLRVSGNCVNGAHSGLSGCHHYEQNATFMLEMYMKNLLYDFGNICVTLYNVAHRCKGYKKMHTLLRSLHLGLR